jgi:curved DNA-binding protein CbpA
LRLLGLTEGATADAIHAAYRRAAKQRHPDRFVDLGPAAVAVATEAFQRLTAAHHLLVETRI